MDYTRFSKCMGKKLLPVVAAVGIPYVVGTYYLKSYKKEVAVATAVGAALILPHAIRRGFDEYNS